MPRVLSTMVVALVVPVSATAQTPTWSQIPDGASTGAALIKSTEGKGLFVAGLGAGAGAARRKPA